MPGEKTIRKCYGPKGLIKRLEECNWIKWGVLGENFEGFEFDGNRLRDEAITARINCQLKVTDMRTVEEFIIKGFCCQNMLDTFFLNKTRWKLMQVAGYYMSDRLAGINSNPYEVSMEVLEGSPHAD